MSYSNGKWFLHLFGFSESKNAVYENIEVEETPTGAIMKSKANGKTYNAGHFTLRNTTSFQNLPVRGGGKLNLLMGGDRRAFPIVDVLQAQSRPEFNGATFLAASNFNCMEFTSRGCESVTSYVGDITQGPYTALACGAAAVYRVYFVPHGDGYKGQLEHEVNILQDTPLPRTMVHGYCVIQPEHIEELMKFDWTDVSKYYVGVHENCQVTTTRDPADRWRFTDAPSEQMVHQVYGAAFNFGSRTKAVIETPDTYKITRYMLEGEYRSTILAAWELSEKYPGLAGSRKVVLTPLGGGVFLNPPEIICEAIAACEELIVQSGLEVYLVSFNGKMKYVKCLEEVVKRTGGEVIKGAYWPNL